MFGSHWGHKMGKNRNFYIFDCVEMNGVNITDMSLQSRITFGGEMFHRLKEELKFLRQLQVYKTHEWKSLWEEYIQEYGYEGLVFKDSRSKYHDKKAWARMKAVVEIDYICTGFRDADKGTKYEGKVGSVLGTLIDKDVYVTCGGITEEQREVFTKMPEMYIGQVFTAKGNNWYPSGAVRHPQFIRWRSDKQPEECSYEQIPEGIRCLS